jgi:hypothetical protein
VAVMLAVIAVAALWVVPLAGRSAGGGHPVVTPFRVTPTPRPEAPYQAQVPGPGCDSGGASWTLVPSDASVQCGSAGLAVTVDPNVPVTLQFVPPGLIFASNYQISARVDLGGLSSGCAGLITRASSQGFYEDDICNDGSWSVFLNTGSTEAIDQGTTASGSVYDIAVQVQGTTLILSINGTTLPAVVSTALTSSDFVGVSINNLGNTTGQATVSNFIYRPLP